MCQNNPQMELITIWGFTEEEVEHRWEVHSKFDPVNRLFGSSEDDEKKPTRVEVPKVNSQEMLSNIERLLS